MFARENKVREAARDAKVQRLWCVWEESNRALDAERLASTHEQGRREGELAARVADLEHQLAAKREAASLCVNISGPLRMS